jgi:fluoroacetyl-CoA thioesterase
MPFGAGYRPTCGLHRPRDPWCPELWRRTLTGVSVEVGLRGEIELLVSDADTAIAFGSGTVPVLATPRVVALTEEACVQAVHPFLPSDQTTVGMRVQLDHLQPTSVGSRVTAEAILDRIEGRRLTFTVHVSDACGLVAAGKVTRVIVETDRFLDRAR